MDIRDNRMDDFLKNTFSGAKSPLPEGMLARILEEKKRKKRMVFWWVNTAILCTVALIGFLVFHYTAQENTDKSNDKVIVKTEQKKAENANAVPDKNENATMPENNTGSKESIATADNNAGSNSASTVKQQNKIPVAKNESPAPKGMVPKPDQAGTNGGGKGPVPASPVKDTAAKIAANNGDGKVAKPEEKPAPVADPEIKKSEPKLAENNPKKVDSFADASAINVSNNKSKKNTHGHSFKWSPELYFSLGWVNEFQKVELPALDPRFTHRDYATLLKSAVNPLTGSYFAFGLQGNIRPHVKVSGGLQYLQTTNKIHYSYLVKDIPLLGPDGSIQGYMNVPDTFQFQLEKNQVVNIHTIAIPLQIGYVQKLGRYYELVGSAGITPQIRFGDRWMTPDKVNLEASKIFDLKNVVNLPSTLSLGLYRREGLYTFGLTGRFNPTSIGSTNNYNGVKVARQRLELGFVLGMKL